MSTFAIILITSSLVLALAAIVAVIVAWRGETSLIAMDDAPTLSVTDLAERHRWATHGVAAFGQPVEVVGTIECDNPLRAPYSETPCVAYDYAVTEESERIVSRGRGRRGREVEFGGLDQQGERVPRFFVHDATGRVAVDTTGARFDLLETVARYEEYTGVTGSEREIWRQEHALPVGNRVFVLGYLLDEGGKPLIGRNPADPDRRFLISYRDERSLAASVRRRAYGFYIAGVFGAGGCVALLVAAALL